MTQERAEEGVDVSLVIVNWNTRQLLLDCLASVYHTVKEFSFEVFVVDNDSTDGSVAAVAQDYPQVHIIQNDRNLGFAAANNKALVQIKGEYALLLGTDTILTQGALSKIWRVMNKHQEAAMACGQLLNGDGSKQNSIANFPSWLTLLCNETLLRLILPHKFPSKRQQYSGPVVVESCIGACLMVRRRAMAEVGLLDERFFVFMEETDWALMMHGAGWQSIFVPDAQIYHLQGQSAGHNVTGRILFYRSRYIYFKKWFPRSWLLLSLLVLLRLGVNFLGNLVGVLATVGTNKGIRDRFLIYAKLIKWHLHGCP